MEQILRYWIVSWDNLGVEYFEEITDLHPDNWAKNHLFDSIKESKKVNVKPGPNVTLLTLRAQLNPQRHYEIYVFTSDDEIGYKEIKKWFTDEPQSFADWVRKNHSYKVYENRKTTKDVIV